jgi:hypothetical protein
MRRVLGGAIVLAILVGGAAPAAAAEKDPNKVALAYFTALFAGSAAEAADAVELAAPDSPAHAYAVHQEAVRRALLASGADSPNIVKRKGDTISLCVPGQPKSQCVLVGRYKLTKKGALRTFAYVDGKDVYALDPPVVGTRQAGSGGGVTLTFVSAFQAEDSLFVVFTATGDPTAARSIYAHQATYTPAGGPPTQAASTAGVDFDLQPGVVGPLLLVFPGSELGYGGTVTVPVNTGPPDYLDASISVTLPSS